MTENKLKFEIIWKDDHIFEMEIFADNGRYSGTIEVYESSSQLMDFANELSRFPFEKETITNSYGEADSESYFKMDFYKVSPAGKCGVKITMEEDVTTEHKNVVKDSLIMELIIEPNAIDEFYKELKFLSVKEKGSAELKAISKYAGI